MSFRVATKLPRLYQSFPTKLFRVNFGRPDVVLRPWKFASALFDIKADHEGYVYPKIDQVEAGNYIGPNGALMRPNSPMLHAVLTKHWMHQNEEAFIYEVEQGTEVTKGLALVHERSDVFSLQPDTRMLLSESTLLFKDFNDMVTKFLQTNGKLYTKKQFLKAYPAPMKIEGAHIVRSILNPGQNNEAARRTIDRPKKKWRKDYDGRYAFGAFKGPKF
ncbi:hypothetical protein VTH82DRAFT_7217 [Thermothelomyces myriococcoides]